MGREFPLPLATAGIAIALVGFGTWSLDALLGLVVRSAPLGLDRHRRGRRAVALGIKAMSAPKQSAA
ncbi:MAG: hypothetical protein M3O64_06085 [Chloroflexota bacterium]|nr:hypothetical protein [Chloroflexota bacterium]